MSWENETKGASLSKLAFHPDFTAVRLYKLTRNVEAKTYSRAAGILAWHLIKTLENALEKYKAVVKANEKSAFAKSVDCDVNWPYRPRA